MLKPYPAYKSSGVEWLGDVPEHWNVSRLSYECWVRARLGWKGLKAEEYVDSGYALLATPNIKCKRIDFENVNFITKLRYDESPEIKLNLGDVLLAKDGSTLGTVNVVRELPIPSTVNSSVAVLTPKASLGSRFLYYYFLSATADNTIQLLKGGMGVPHLFQSDLNGFRIQLPPLSEQIAIANYLDAETTRIDNLIHQQQRLIELLQEKLDSLVHAAMTSASVDRVRLTYTVTIITRPVIQRDGESYEPLGLFNRGRGLFHKPYREKDEMGDSDFFWIKDGDLIISGQFAWEGALALAGPKETDCVVSHRYPVLLGKPGVTLTEWLFAFLSTRHGNFLLNEASVGAAGRNRPLNLNLLLNEKIPVPSLPAQVRVAKAVKVRTRLVEKAARQIQLLEERRRALISAAVTGRIDLREPA